MNNLNEVTNIVSKLKILRAAELASLLGISQTSLWRWRQKGDFPQPIALGPRMVGWRISEVEAWLDESRLAA